MKELALDGVHIVLPHLLDVDERALPLAEQEVLEGRNRQKVFVGVFRTHLMKGFEILRPSTNVIPCWKSSEYSSVPLLFNALATMRASQ